MALGVFGQNGGGYTQSRILFLLDESSSMLQSWEGAGDRPKHKIANEIVVKLMDSIYAINPHVEFSLRVFGNQYTVPEQNCQDTKSEVPFSPDNRTQMEFRLDAMHPLGVTAIAYSLSQAAEEDLVDVEHNAYSIILITDGGESCGGDICAVMQKLIRNKVFFKPYILSLEDLPELKSEYACMGEYLQVTKKSDITRAVATILQAFKPIIKISKEEYQKLQMIAASAPSILKVSIPQIKVESVTDSLPVKPETPVTHTAVTPVKPKPEPKPRYTPPPADSLVTPKPAPKPSAIVVGEEQPRTAPVPLQMKKISFSAVSSIFTARPKYKPQMLEISIPELKPMEPEPVIPGPVKMVGLAFSDVHKLKIVKPVLVAPVPLSIEVPEIKAIEAEPVIVIPPPVKMKAITFSAISKWKVTIPKIEMVRSRDTLIQIPEPIAPPQPVAFAKIEASKPKKIKIKKPAPYAPELLVITVPEIKIPEPEPEKPAFAKVEAVVPTRIKELTVDVPKLAKLKKVKVATPELKPMEPDVVKIDTITPVPVVVSRPHDVFVKLKASTFKMHLLYTNPFLDAEIKPLKVTPPPVYKPPVITPVAPVKPVASKPTPKTGEYKVEHEDAPETTLEVYLTNGKGKFFTTTPRIVLTDPANGKEIRRFFRTVDPSGNPDPVTNLPAGKYDLEIVGRDDLLAHVDLQPNKKNKVIIKVNDYSLYFYYYGAPDRPVSEFSAEVIQRNTANGRVQVQKCTEKLEYEPGNYHITINTFPQDVRNVTLETIGAGGIGIPQPGFVKFVAETKTTSVGLYKQVGDKFLQFYTLNLSDPSSSHLQIQPGKYQAHYNNGETKFSISEKVISFDVKSLVETTVTLVK